MPNDPTQNKAYYRIYNETTQTWDYYFFKTTADQILTNNNLTIINSGTKVNGCSFTITNDGANAEATITGGDVNWYKGTRPSTSNLTNATTIQAALVALDSAIGSVVPTNVVTYDANGNIDLGTSKKLMFGDNYGIQIYQGDLTLFTGSGNIVLSPENYAYYGEPTANNEIATHGWAVPQTRTINGYALSSNINLYADDINYSSSSQLSIYDVVQGIESQVNGIAMSYAISDAVTTSGTFNAQFNSTANSISFTISKQAILKSLDGTDILAADLKIGDTVFVSELDVPDRWLASRVDGTGAHSQETTLTFYKLETYNMTWGAIANKPTTLSGYGITDASISNGTITLGSNSINTNNFVTTTDLSTALGDYLPTSGGTLTGELWFEDGNGGDVLSISHNTTTNNAEIYAHGRQLELKSMVSGNWTGVKVYGGIDITTGASSNYWATIQGSSSATANRTYTLPNKSSNDTFAMLSDVPTITVTAVGGSTPSSGMKAGDICIQVTA